MLLWVPTPLRLDRQTDPARLSPFFASELNHVDISSIGRSALRGPGVQRCAGMSGVGYVVNGTGVLVRADCSKVVIDSHLNGVWRAHQVSAYNKDCVGPTPDCLDVLNNTDFETCEGELGCSEYDSGRCDDLSYDLEITIEDSDVQDGQAVTTTPFDGTRKVRPCIAGSLSEGVDPESAVRVKVTNNSSYCIRGVLWVRVAGLSCGCTVQVNYSDDQDNTSTGSLVNGKNQWANVCLASGSNIVVCLQHSVRGGDYCCGRNAIIDNFLFSHRCSDQDPDGGCALASDLASIPINDFRVHDDLSQCLPSSAGDDDLGIITPTWKTNAPYLATSDWKMAVVTQYARTLYALPGWYVSGLPFKLIITTEMDTPSYNSSVLDVEVFRIADPTVDLCQTVAQDINDYSEVETEFLMDESNLTNGDLLDIRLKVTTDDDDPNGEEDDSLTTILKIQADFSNGWDECGACVDSSAETGAPE